MKYLIALIFCFCSKWTEAQVIDSSWITIDSNYTHTDSVNIQLTEFIYNNRNCYIGSPMNKLYADLPISIGFSAPNTVWRIGIVGYQYFTLYLPSKDGDGCCYGFSIAIAEKINVNMKDYIEKCHIDEDDDYLKDLLRLSIITSIEKNY